MRRFVLYLGIAFCWFICAGKILAQEGSGSSYLQWRYNLSGEERFRYEQKDNFDFSDGAKDSGAQLYNRFRISFGADLVDEYLNPKVSIVVEGLDAQAGGYRKKANSGQRDDFDLHQSFLKIYNILGSDFDVKLGRQELKYGKCRLIAAPSWSNRIRSFDAGVLHYEKSGFYGDIIYGQNVQYDDNEFNKSTDEILTGAYLGYREHKLSPLVEWYYLAAIDKRGNSDIRRHTVGARLQTKIIWGAVMDIEVPYQFGQTGTITSGTQDVSAYAVHVDINKTFESVFWKPVVSISYDQASGDRDPNDSRNNTFIPLYQSTHDPYGIMDLFRWQNVRNPELRVTFSPTQKFNFSPGVDLFWLDNVNDAWYSSSGGVLRNKTTGDKDSYVGCEASIKFCYDLTKNIKAEAGYAHFFAGGYVKDTGANDDADWAYSQITFKF